MSVDRGPVARRQLCGGWSCTSRAINPQADEHVLKSRNSRRVQAGPDALALAAWGDCGRMKESGPMFDRSPASKNSTLSPGIFGQCLGGRLNRPCQRRPPALAVIELDFAIPTGREGIENGAGVDCDLGNGTTIGASGAFGRRVHEFLRAGSNSPGADRDTSSRLSRQPASLRIDQAGQNLPYRRLDLIDVEFTPSWIGPQLLDEFRDARYRRLVELAFCKAGPNRVLDSVGGRQAKGWESGQDWPARYGNARANWSSRESARGDRR